MKKTISLLLIGCLVLTIVVSAAPVGNSSSVPLNNYNTQIIVGGNQAFWCNFAFYSFGAWTDVALGLAAVSLGWGLAVGAVVFAASALMC